jgi:hypothetical protein
MLIDSLPRFQASAPSVGIGHFRPLPIELGLAMRSAALDDAQRDTFASKLRLNRSRFSR